jgi:carnosine N-methyltransferase
LDEIGWKKKLDEVDAAIQANARFLRQIVMHPEIFEGRVDFEGEEDGDELTAEEAPQLGYSKS